MEYAHEGERILRKREAEKNPVPVEMRHGLQNAYALAGHEDFEGDMTELMYQKEGIIMRIYITFVNKVLSPIYVTLTLPWMFVGTLAYMPIVCLSLSAVMWLARKLSPWIVNRAEERRQRQNAATSEASKNLYNAEIPELEDEDAILYLVLDFEPQTSLTFTRDASRLIFNSNEAEDKVPVGATTADQTTHQSFKKGGVIAACETLSYSALCVDPANRQKRIRVIWMVADEGPKKDSKTYQKRGFVPVDAVVPTLSRQEAREKYARQVRAYHYTGTTTVAWDYFFTRPLLSTWWLAMTVTLAVRFVVAAFCWPLEMFPQTRTYCWFNPTSWQEWGAYSYSFLKTVQERTLLGFARPLVGSALKRIEFINLLL